MSQGPQSSILLLEADLSLQRIMMFGLQHRGMRVLEGNSLTTLSEEAIQAADLLVLDIDAGTTSNWALLEYIQHHPQLALLPVVVLSWEIQTRDRQATVLSGAPSAVLASNVTCLAKPFDARALHRVIDQQLSLVAEQQANRQATLEAGLLAAYATKHTTTSFWPIVTAAGLLLTVIGFLFQFFIALLGILIVIVALLAWSIGKSPETRTAMLSSGVVS